MAALGHHAPSCKVSAKRSPRRSVLNGIIKGALRGAGTPSILEPDELDKRPGDDSLSVLYAVQINLFHKL